MSKLLILLRHAKSSWKDTGLEDYDRPLNKRGKKAAPLMGKRLCKMLFRANISIDLILSSSAKRARKTARLFATEIQYPKHHIKFNHSLYHADTTQLLKTISQQAGDLNSIILVGHNPGFTHLTNRLLDATEHYFSNIPTAGLVILKLDIGEWIQIESFVDDQREVPGIKLLHYDYPKSEQNQNKLSFE